MLHEGTLQPNEHRTIGVGAHSQIFIMECDSEYLDVKFHGLSKIPMYRGVPAQYDFENAIISNPHATVINYKIYTAPKRMEFQEGRSIEAGPKSITGNNGSVNAPLTTEGGSITPLGGSYSAFSATGGNGEIVSAAANTNGVLVRTAKLIVLSGASAALNSLQGAYNNMILSVANVNTVEVLEREIYVPPGDPFAWYFNAAATCYVNTTYDIL